MMHTTAADAGNSASHLEGFPDLPVEVRVDLAFAHHRYEFGEVDETIAVKVHLTGNHHQQKRQTMHEGNNRHMHHGANLNLAEAGYFQRRTHNLGWSEITRTQTPERNILKMQYRYIST